MTTKIHIGEGEDNKEISIPLFHTGIFGQSGTGKTTLLKYMIEQAVQEGFRFIIFDSKLTGAEFEGMGKVVPFYLQENTDPDVYRSLIEGVRTRGHGNMERFRSGFIELCEPAEGKQAESFAEIEGRLKSKLNDPKIKGFTKSMYSEIYHDHLRLKELLATYNFEDSPEWILDIDIARKWNPLLRMPTRELPNLNLQGLVVRSVVEALLKNASKVIVVVDEAPNFVNQRQYNPAKSALQQLDAQGRSKELFGWYTGQTLSGFDKSVMKNLWFWLMSREMEKNEVKAVYDTQTDKVLTMDGIKKLKVREFIVSTPDWAKLCTVPLIDPRVAKLQAKYPWLPRDVAAKVISGEVSLDSDEVKDWKTIYEASQPEPVQVESFTIKDDGAKWAKASLEKYVEEVANGAVMPIAGYPIPSSDVWVEIDERLAKLEKMLA